MRARRLCLLLACVVALTGCDLFVSPQARLERAQTHIERGQHRAALVEIKNALAKQPEQPEARLLLAEVALWLGDAASAETELARVPSAFEPQRTWQVRGRIDLALGRFQKVLDDLSTNGSSLDPTAALLLRGRALIGLRDGAAAESAFRAALERDPQESAARIGIIEALALQGKQTEALGEAERLLSDEPNSAEAAYVHGRLLLRTDAASALASLERAQSSASRQLDVRRQIELLTLLAELQLDRGLLDQARESSAALSRIAPGAPIAILIASRIAMVENDYAKAAADLRRVVNAAPRFTRARFLLGASLLAQGNLEQASQELSIVVAEAPEMLEARQLLAQVRMRLNDPDGAMRVLVAALDVGNERAQALHSLIGAARSQVGPGGRAAEILEQELAKNPENDALALELATALLQSGDPIRALQTMDQRESLSRAPRAIAIRLQATLQAKGRESAVAQARALLGDLSDDANAISVVAAFLAQLGNVDEARRHLASGLERAPRSPDLLLTSALLAWHTGAIDQAREAIRVLLKHDPRHGEAQLMLAELDLASGNVTRAEQQLEQLRKEDPLAVRARVLLARAALSRNEMKRAEALVEEILKGPDDAATHLIAGDLYLAHGRYAQAIPLYRKAVELDAHNASAWLNLGRAQLALGQHALARSAFERAQSMRPGWTPIEGALVFLDLEDGKSQDALDRVQALKASRPDDVGVLAIEGNALMMMRRYRDAAAVFDKALELNLTRETAVSAYQARVAAGEGKPWEPLARWVAVRPNDLAARSVLADAYMKATADAKAIEQYEYIIARAPTNAAALNNLAWLYQQARDPRALETARRAHAAAPTAAAISDTLGWILLGQGQVEESLEHLERAAQAARGNPDIQYHYSAALARSGMRDEARQRLEKVISEYPSFSSYDEARSLLAALVETSGGGVPLDR